MFLPILRLASLCFHCPLALCFFSTIAAFSTIVVSLCDALFIELLTFYYLLQLSFVRKVAKRRSNISLYADELGRGFVGELDYNIEAANATKFLVLLWSCLVHMLS